MHDMGPVRPIHASLVEVDGASLYYEVSGDGPHLILGHAGVADRRMWDAQFSALAEHYRVVRYDRRGFGDSTVPRGSFSHRRDLYQFMRSLGIERAHLVGCSAGGAAMIEFALEHPEMARSLILVSSGLGGYRSPSEMPPARAELPIALKVGDVRHAAEIGVRIWVDGPRRTPDQVDPRIRERVREMSRTALLNLFVAEEPLDPPSAERLGSLRVPALVVAGELDEPDVLALAEILRTHIPGARKAIVAGAAHLLNMEKAEDFNRLVLDFLARKEG